MWNKLLLSFLLVILLARESTAKKAFQSKIPNGANVPDWPAVGHITRDAKNDHARNAFGNDFNQEKNKWTTNLCQMDSDADGRTNGEELGDPGCIWKEGDAPSRLTEITNPGIFNDFTKIEKNSSSTQAPASNSSNSGDHETIETWIIFHAILMALTFGLIMPLSSTVPYFLRNYREGGKWRGDHMNLMYLANIGGLLGFFIAVFSMGIENTVHGILGVTVFVLLVLQSSFGFFRQSLPSWMRFRLVHSFLGRSLIFLIAAQVFFGYLELNEYAPIIAVIIGFAHTAFILIIFIAITRVYRKRMQENSSNKGGLDGDEPGTLGDFAPLDSLANVRGLELQQS